jgi:hypothetical protein
LLTSGLLRIRLVWHILLGAMLLLHSLYLGFVQEACLTVGQLFEDPCPGLDDDTASTTLHTVALHVEAGNDAVHPPCEFRDQPSTRAHCALIGWLVADPVLGRPGAITVLTLIFDCRLELIAELVKR